MSATNHTTTIELSQYISTDKPTYLTDYNGDMLKIDNAIAADREAITAAQSKANTADGKADANKTSIDTLGEQINGDPLDPLDTGLAGAVSANTGSINTINSLIGNGEPTTTDKTLIGAINELNADIVTPSTGIDARVTAAESAISTLDGEVGDLTDLDTTVKTSLVGAINEVNGKSVKYRVVTSVNADTTITFGDALTTLNAAYNLLSTAEKEMCVIDLDGRIMHILSVAAGTFCRSDVASSASNSFTANLRDHSYYRMLSDASGNTFYDDSNTVLPYQISLKVLDI